jgi:hypothetical protein
MPNMQAFHQSLSASPKASDSRHTQLARLTRIKRDQILALTSELTWYIWEAEQEAAPTL